MSWFISLENGRPSDLIVTCVEDVLRFATTTVNSVNVTNVGCTWDPAAVFVVVVRIPAARASFHILAQRGPNSLCHDRRLSASVLLRADVDNLHKQASCRHIMNE